MPRELREFVYLDDLSVNSHLSSLGRAVPQSIVEQDTDETETEGDLSARVPMVDIGAGGRRAWIDSMSTETQMKVTEPYRFEDLLEALDENEIDIHENPDVRACQRGDVVRINGNTRPMSLYRVEVAVQTFRNLLTDDMIEAIEQLSDQGGGGMEEIEANQFDYIMTMLERATGDEIPLRIDTEDDVYGTALDRDKMRIPHERAFIEPTEYTLIGRILSTLPRNDSWDPIEASNLLDTYMDNPETSAEFREAIFTMANELNIAMPDDLVEIEGRTAIVYPIAIFW